MNCSASATLWMKSCWRIVVIGGLAGRVRATDEVYHRRLGCAIARARGDAGIDPASLRRLAAVWLDSRVPAVENPSVPSQFTEESATMSSGIESVLQENRVFPPPRPSSSRRTSPAWPPTRRCAPRPSATSRASGRGMRARERAVAQAVHEDARRIQRAVLQVVPRRRAERVVQLPRPAPRRRSPTRSRSSSRRTTARSPRSPTRSSTTTSAGSRTR